MLPQLDMKGYVLSDNYALDSNVLKVSSTMGEAVLQSLELPVWVGGCLKWMTGLSRSTTCDEVVYALLLQIGAPGMPPDVLGHSLYHRTAGVERPLRGRTKIVKAWESLGCEQDGACFVLRKVNVSNDRTVTGEMGRPRRFKKPCSYSGPLDGGYPPNEAVHPHTHELPPLPPPVPQRITRGPAHYRTPPNVPHHQVAAQSAQEQFKMWKKIIEQERKIQEQIARIRETDIQIETYETKVHLGRVKENGKNYVQEAYLRERAEDSSICESSEGSNTARASQESSGAGAEASPENPEDEKYLGLCQSILDMEDKIQAEQNRIESLSKTILEESCALTDSVSTADNSFTSNSDNGYQSLPEDQAQGELQTLKRELNRSISAGIAHEEQHTLVDKILQDYEQEMMKKNALLLSLIEEAEEEEEQNKQDNPLVFSQDISSIQCSSGTGPELEGRTDIMAQSPERLPDTGNLQEPLTAKAKGSKRIIPHVQSVSMEILSKQLESHGVYWVQDSVCMRDHDALSEDSDTGLSSLHSGDECPTLLETLV